MKNELTQNKKNIDKAKKDILSMFEKREKIDLDYLDKHGFNICMIAIQLVSYDLTPAGKDDEFDKWVEDCDITQNEIIKRSMKLTK